MAVLNLSEFNKTLTQAIPAAIMAELRGSIEEAVKPMVAEMKSLAAYDIGLKPRRHPQHLRDSIRARWVAPNKAENSALGLKMVIIAGSSETGVLVNKKRGHRLQLARLIEFGTQKHKARPFFFPIWRINRSKIRRKISVRVNAVITGYSNTGSSSGGLAA